ncbi:MAG: CPBP family intramembrane metalloprotease [Cryomorphaceae bacterium]|nr:MAG: CPBP family intramembrane metalloprotease [Cryomorphaceae bacterium]
MRNNILHLATLTLLGFPLIGWIILLVAGGPDFYSLFAITSPLWQQLGIGLLTGTAAGFMAWRMIQSAWMTPLREKYAGFIGKFRLKPWQVVYISLCAGIGEEILFRGVIQPYLGIWITAVLFVAIHGYLNPMDKRVFVYGLYMTLVIGLIGYQTEWFGLYTAMAAHTAIDVVLLGKMSKIQTETQHSGFTLNDEDEPSDTDENPQL